MWTYDEGWIERASVCVCVCLCIWCSSALTASVSTSLLECASTFISLSLLSLSLSLSHTHTHTHTSYSPSFLSPYHECVLKVTVQPRTSLNSSSAQKSVKTGIARFGFFLLLPSSCWNRRSQNEAPNIPRKFRPPERTSRSRSCCRYRDRNRVRQNARTVNSPFDLCTARDIIFRNKSQKLSFTLSSKIVFLFLFKAGWRRS